MNASDINNINTANFILRHFVDLSARLLPLLHDLTQKRNPTEEEKNSIRKIVSVYSHYKFDTNTSVQLINSNILELIQKTFENIVDAQRKKNIERKLYLDHFLYERDRLIDVWETVEAN